MFPNRPSGRKRWKIHGDGLSLRRMRNQLAEDGCADSQVVLAKLLLEERCELESDKVSNFEQALDWLICATEQGHVEARKILRRCIHSGVCDQQNAAIARAKLCLAASRQETVARKAARDLFASLSNGEQYITTLQLERRIREICNVTLQKEVAEAEEKEIVDDIPDENAEDGVANDQALEPSQFHDQPVQNGTISTSHEYDYDAAEPEPQDEPRNLTVDNLVTAAINYCHGELPLISYEMTLTEPGVKALNHIPLFHRALLHPIMFIQILYLKLLYYFGSFSFRFTNLELSLVLLAYLTFNADSISNFVPLVLFYISFIAMVVCTFKMLSAKRRFIDFRKWSGLFLRYSDGNLQPDESENLFVRNNLAPFFQFFLALFVNLFFYTFISSQWVPFSEFCVMAFVLTFLTLFSFGTNGFMNPDILAFLSFCINVLAKYPYEKDTVVHQGWRFLDFHIQNYPSYILGNGIEFCLNARVFFSLLIPVILFLMARRQNWQGFLMYALPHCVTLSWLQMFIMCSHSCTTYGLIRGTLALVCAFLFVPLMGVATLLLPVFACLQHITMSELIYITCVMLGLALYFSVTCLLAKHDFAKRFVTPFQLLIATFALLYFGNLFIGNIQESLPSRVLDLLGDKKETYTMLNKIQYSDDVSYKINWDNYHSQCLDPSWTETNMAATQIKCSVLHGANIDWDGYVKEVKLVNVKNKWAEYLGYLPHILQDYIMCYYGEEFSTLCQERDSLYSIKECEFMQSVARRTGATCHMNNFNEYIYKVVVAMESGGGILQKQTTDITIKFDNEFTNFTRLLRANDKIKFKGLLQNEPNTYSIGTSQPNLVGYEITCLKCKDGAIQNVRVTSKVITPSKFSSIFKTVLDDCIVSAKYILNFILNPVIVIK